MIYEAPLWEKTVVLTLYIVIGQFWSFGVESNSPHLLSLFYIALLVISEVMKKESAQFPRR